LNHLFPILADTSLTQDRSDQLFPLWLLAMLLLATLKFQ
jgi:hypothetical protein